jgi:hypothetical protein
MAASAERAGPDRKLPSARPGASPRACRSLDSWRNNCYCCLHSPRGPRGSSGSAGDLSAKILRPGPVCISPRPGVVFLGVSGCRGRPWATLSGSAGQRVSGSAGQRVSGSAGQKMSPRIVMSMAPRHGSCANQRVRFEAALWEGAR